MVARAAAQIAVEFRANRGVIEWTLVACKINRAHDHARGAKAALQSVMRAKGFLHGVQLTVCLRQAFNRGDGGALGLQRERVAAFDRFAVEQDRTGAALCSVAANVGSGKPQVIAQKMHKQRARFDLGGGRFAIYCGVHFHRHRPLAAGFGRAHRRGGETAVRFRLPC